MRVAQRAREPRYTVPEAARFIDRPSSTVRRWALGNPRTYWGVRRIDEPLITVDGDRSGDFPVSFLNLLELRFLASYRQRVPLQSIRTALEFAGEHLEEERPLLTADFKIHGKTLFLKFAERDPYFVNASRKGQLAWPEALDGLFESIDYDPTEGAVVSWWPLGKDAPVVIDTRLNGGQPSTSVSRVRTIAIAAKKRQGFEIAAITEDVTASQAEIEAALRFERVATAA
jgi:uncharacterized protein (DUF433 family)